MLIMDEPTAVLTPQEVETLFGTLRDMTAHGHTIVFISHKLDEVVAIADHVTVMRRGEVTAAAVPSKGITKPQLAKLMVGRDVMFLVQKKKSQPGDVVLATDHLCADNDRGLPALQNISIQLHAGEILGVAGVAGNGQRELAEVLTGLRNPTSGTIFLGDQQLDRSTNWMEISQKLAHIPEDRAAFGSVPGLGVSENLILKSFNRPPISTGWSINTASVRENGTRLVKQYNISTPTIDTPARMLSGGNLQKVILARETSGRPNLMIAVHPTRGLDIGAIEGIHNLLIELRDQGTAILLISEELDEIFSLADRIAVMYEGMIVGELPPERANLNTVGLMMAGTKVES